MKTNFYYYFFILPKSQYVYDVRFTPHLVQIYPSYSLFHYNKNHDILHYNTKHRRDIKKKMYKDHLVDNHHIIPKEFNNHPLLRELQVDTSCSKNIIFLPNRYAKEWIGHEEWIFHTSHPKYNKYVLKELNSIHQLNDKENRYYQFSLFFMYLYQSLEHNEPNIKKLFS